MRQDLSTRLFVLQNAAFGLAATFLIAVTLAVLSSGSAWADRVALVIGNGEYRSAGALGNPPKDAEAIAEKLRALDFQVTKALNADLHSMRSALQQFTLKARTAEIAVIFYAGHGLQVDGENYLIPVDAAMNSRTDLPKSALSASEIYQSLVAAQPDVAVLILDACRDNPFAKALSTAPGLASGSVSSSALVQHPNSAGMLIGFAAAPGAVAYDGGDGNSPFTTALLQWIARPGLELATMLRRVRNTVVELTRGAQVPWVEEALLREVYLYPADPSAIEHLELGERIEVALLDRMRALSYPEERTAAREFYRRLTGDDDVAVLMLGAAARDAPDQGEEFVKQGLVWLSIRESSDPEIFQKYLGTFPNSPFAPAATERLKKIEAERAAAPIQVASLVTKTGILILGESSAAEAVFASDLPNVNPAAREEVRPSALTQTEARVGRTEAPLASTESTTAEPQGPAAQAEALLDGTDALVVRPDKLSPTQPEGLQVAAVEIMPNEAKETEAALGLARDALAAVQTLLTEAGQYRGRIDANFGPGTRKAIAAFQKASSLGGDGYLTQPTLQQLVHRFGRTALNALTDVKRRDGMQLVAAIAERGADAKPIVLRVAAMSRNDSVHAFWRDLALDFEDAHPGYRVEITHQPDYQYKVTLLGMLGSETPPDIMHTWGGGHLDALRAAGFARDLTEDMSKGWALEFRPGPLQSYVRDGRIYGVPASVELVSLWVNKVLLAKAGVTPDQLSTWDGLLQAVRKLKLQGIVPIAVGGRDRWPFQLIWGSLAEQMGGRDAFVNAVAGSGDGFLAPAFVEAGRRLRQLADLDPFQPDFMSVGEGEAGMLFSKGAAAMVITGNWRLNTMRWNWPGGFDRMKQELLRLDIPGTLQASDGPLTYGGVDGYAVNSKAPDMAVELVRVLTSRAVQSRIAQLADSVPSVSGSDLALTDPFVGEVADTLLQSRYHQLYVDQALGPIVGEVVNEVATKLATGQIDGEDAAREIDLAWDQTSVSPPTGGGAAQPQPVTP